MNSARERVIHLSIYDMFMRRGQNHDEKRGAASNRGPQHIP